MKSPLLLLHCLAIVLLAAPLMAEDAAKPKAKAETFSGKVEDFKGTVASKALDAKDGIAAVMKITRGDKVEWVNLWTTGEAAKKLDDIAAQRGEVTVTGILSAEGIKVSKVGDDLKLPPAGKKKKK